MTIFIFSLILLIIQNVKTEYCSDIQPRNSADCKLSSIDISIGSKYCCYDSGLCLAYDETEYQKEYGSLTPNFCNTQTTTATGCESVTPNSASDCVLSQEDKKNGNIYCCYMVDDGVKRCSAETKEVHEMNKLLFEETSVPGDVYQCQNKSIFISLSFIYLLSILLSL